jgi:hypothetical protein
MKQQNHTTRRLFEGSKSTRLAAIQPGAALPAEGASPQVKKEVSSRCSIQLSTPKTTTLAKRIQQTIKDLFFDPAARRSAGGDENVDIKGRIKYENDQGQNLTKQKLIKAADKMTGGNIQDLTVKQLERLMTVTQFVTDLCLNEPEDRGELVLVGDTPLVPYAADYRVETILTRNGHDQ